MDLTEVDGPRAQVSLKVTLLLVRALIAKQLQRHRFLS